MTDLPLSDNNLSLLRAVAWRVDAGVTVALDRGYLRGLFQRLDLAEGNLEGSSESMDYANGFRAGLEKAADVCLNHKVDLGVRYRTKRSKELKAIMRRRLAKELMFLAE